MSLLQSAAALVNRGVSPLLRAPGVGSVPGRNMVELSYVGRKSGRPISLVVSYRRRGDDLLVGVAVPDQKSWWRNFYPDGGPIGVRLDGRDRTGYATARRGQRGTSVTIALDPLAGG